MQIYDKQVNAKRIHAELNYAKLILAKVSFNQALFEKELRKAIATLLPHEVEDLEDWCYSHFSDMYEAVLQDCFSKPSITRLNHLQYKSF